MNASRTIRVSASTASLLAALLVASSVSAQEQGGPREPGDRFVLTASATTTAALEQIAREDPEALARMGRERYDREIRDYRCTFIKQERIRGKLRPAEVIDVRYDEEPRSVFMVWQQNADQARRALYRDLPAFRNRHGKAIAKVEPNGAIARLFVSEAEIEIHGDAARKSSRRAIDDFGFRNTLQLLEDYNDISREAGVLDYRYAGQGEIDGRPTFVFHRFLPYREGGPYPDAKLIMHLDQEWLLPVAVYSYADRAGNVLLGSYVFKDVRLNPGLTESDFRF